MPLIHGTTTKFKRYIDDQLVESGWRTARKEQARFVVCSPWMRYECPIFEGKSKRPDDRYAQQIDRELRKFAEASWRFSAKRCADKAFSITERAMAQGHIADLTDPKTSTQWVRIYVLAYTIGYAAGKIMPGPDLELSDFTKLSIVYYAPGYELNIKGFQDSLGLIVDLWGCPVLIEPYPGLPQAIWIRPVQVEQVDTEFSEDFAAMPTIDEISFGTSLLNSKQHITFSFKDKDNIENMLVVGMTRSGKSTWVQNAMIGFMQMRNQVEGMSYIDGSYSPGLSILRSIGVRVADDKETVQSEIHFVQDLAERRDALMKEKGWIKWPVGHVLNNGTTTGIWVVVMDETHKFFAKFPPNSTEGGIVRNWPTDLLKRGIMIVSITPNFTEKEGPGVYWGAHEWKVMFHVEEAVTIQRMFHKDRGTFTFYPTDLGKGQYCMKLPGAMNLVYGMGHPPMILKLTDPQQKGSTDG